MSSRLKQTKIDVATANPWTGASPGGGAAHLVRATDRVAQVSAAPPGGHAGTLPGWHKRKKAQSFDWAFCFI
ncbi:hypothetical protein NUKP16_37370 [Klebsiella quasipneumoniae]|nr:hypothetical protein NUKP16_37370 [Klebsiella quasipneumoniae]GKQ06155.1 hypothetical protein NUKP771_47340 [Klebsiella quasipneumoniae]